MKPSRSFLHTLVGLAITVAGYAADVAWAFQRAFLVWDTFRIESIYPEMTRAQQAVVSRLLEARRLSRERLPAPRQPLGVPARPRGPHRHEHHPRGVLAPFTIAGVTVPAGIYHSREAQIVEFTNGAARVQFRLRAHIGGFFGGRRAALTPALRVRFSDALNTDVSLARTDADLPAGRFTTNLARARVSYSFTPRTFLQGLVQYNDDADLWSANVRFGWLQQANTGLFIVFNDTQPLDDFRPGPVPSSPAAA